MRSLIERNGGVAIIAPTMREIPLSDNPAAFHFGEELLAGRIDVVVFLTGVGARGLFETLESRFAWEDLKAALERCVIVVRGPKPTAVLRERKVRIDHSAPEPNTWHELLTILDAHVPVQGKIVAVQEYGEPSDEFYTALQSRGARVLPTPVYRWALPEDLGPLKDALRRTIAGEIDVLMFTSAGQLSHLLQVAENEGVADAFRQAAQRCVIASVGPTAADALREAGFEVDIEPEHSKMGHLVRAAAESAGEILIRKRAS
ncbi:MAG TPA: uroporphyrinogen-III synthase [Planctomycetaceae bacterium]|nr:uroporphyrinogen-III synthase [Planctomycetaceae bacterium]